MRYQEHSITIKTGVSRRGGLRVITKLIIDVEINVFRSPLGVKFSGGFIPYTPLAHENLHRNSILYEKTMEPQSA